MEMRLKTAALLLLTAPLLAACGEEPVHDYSDAGTVVGADGAPSPEPKKSDVPSAAPDGSTIARAALTSEQAQLYDDVLLFEETAIAAAAQGKGSVGTLSEQRDPDDRFEIVKPAGIQVAERYEISWNEGKLVSYALISGSGERVEAEAGTISIDVEVDTAQDPVLVALLDEVSVAAKVWTAKHGEPPFVTSSMFDGLQLTGGMSDDSLEPVKLDLPEGIRTGDSSRTNDEFSAEFHCDRSRESATITQDGITYFRTYQVV